MNSPYLVRSLLLTGVAGPLVFGIVVFTSGALRSNYSHVHQFISELGETGGEFAWLMNYFGFMLSASLILIFVLTFRRQFPRTAINTVGTLLLAVFAIGVFLAGVYSCDAGCSPTNSTREQNLHDVASLALPTFTLGVAVWGVYFCQLPRWRRFGIYSLITAVSSVILLVAMVQSEASRDGTGVYQRLFLGVLFIWMIALSVWQWRTNGSDRSEQRAA